MGDPRIAALLNSGTTMAHLYSVAAAYINHNQPYGQSGIYIYGSANGGQNWSGPAEVAVNLDGNVRLDQPVIAASWATSTNTTNFRYIAYTMYNIPDRANGSIRFRRSRGPIFCFGRCRIVGTPTPAFDAEQTPIVGNVASPQIAVDNTGAVHIVYVRYNAGQNGAHTIEEIVSDVPLDPTAALAWSGPRVVAQFFEVASDTVNGGIRAVTIPHARFNPAANRLCVTWHAATALLGATTQVYYASRAIGSPNFEGGTAIDPVAGRDQFMPALDSDATGNVLLAWYDRRNDGTNRDYEHFVRYITATGGTITGLDSHPSVVHRKYVALSIDCCGLP